MIDSDEHLFHSDLKLIKKCVRMFSNIDKSIEKKYIKLFFKDVYYNYNTNPFHNFKHAFEVFQMSYMLLKYVPNISIFNKKVLLIVSICHDIQHFGYNNKELLTIQHSMDSSFDISLITPDRTESFDTLNNIESTNSINESIHIKFTHLLTLKYIKAFFGEISLNDLKHLNDIIISLVMATDLSLHEKYFRIIKEESTELSKLIHILKLSDISHPLRNFRVHLYWVFNLLNEENNALLHEDLKYIAYDTLKFIDLFVEPLVQTFTLKYIDGTFINDRLSQTKNKWIAYL